MDESICLSKNRVSFTMAHWLGHKFFHTNYGNDFKAEGTGLMSVSVSVSDRFAAGKRLKQGHACRPGALVALQGWAQAHMASCFVCLSIRLSDHSP